MSDADALAHYNAMIATISGNLPAYAPLVAADVTASGAIRDDMSDLLLTHNQSHAQATADTAAKNVGRKLMDDDKRKIRALLKANGATEAAINALDFPSAGPSGEGGGGVTVPVATIDTSERLRHTINFADASAPNLKRRPKGVVGCEIWVKIDGPPPGNETECVFLALDSATPYVAEFPPEHAGKTAHYLFRWQMKDGTRSAFGETVSATITG